MWVFEGFFLEFLTDSGFISTTYSCVHLAHDAFDFSSHLWLCLFIDPDNRLAYLVMIP